MMLVHVVPMRLFQVMREILRPFCLWHAPAYDFTVTMQN